MIEPRLEDYDLNEQIIQNLRDRSNKIDKTEETASTVIYYTFGGITLISWIIYKAPYRDFWDFLLLGLFIGAIIAAIAVFITIIVIMIVYSIIRALVRLDKNSKEYYYSVIKEKEKEYNTALSEYKSWDYRNKQSFWISMNGFRYEKEVGKLFSKKGYQVTTTRGTGDGGVDIILQKDGKLTIVQCKNTKKPAGPAIVRDLYGTMINFNAHEAILVSTSGCTKGAKEFIMGKPISVLSLAHLIEMNK